MKLFYFLLFIFFVIPAVNGYALGIDAISISVDPDDMDSFERSKNELSRLAREKTANLDKYRVINDDLRSGLSIIPVVGSKIGSKIDQMYLKPVHDKQQKAWDTKIAATLYTAYLDDQNKVSQMFAIKNEFDRLVAVMDHIQGMQSYITDAQPMNTTERAVMNSRAIISLINITKEFNLAINNNTQEIEKLKTDFDDYKKQQKDIDKLTTLDVKSEGLRIKAAQQGREIASKMGPVIEDVVSEQKTGKINPGSQKRLEDTQMSFFKMMLTAQEYVGYAQQAYQVALNLGLKGKDAERAGRAVMYASATVAVGMAVAAPGPGTILAAVSMASMLFKKQGEDASMQRHKQIMDAFKQVFENQRLMLENQKKMMELMVETHKVLVDFYKYTVKSFSRVDEKLELIIGNQTTLIRTILKLSDIYQKMQHCGPFFDSRFSGCNDSDLEPGGNLHRCYRKLQKKEYPDFLVKDFHNFSIMVNGTFADYDSFIRHFNEKDGDYLSNQTNRDRYMTCSAFLDQIFYTSGTSSLFQASTYLDSDNRRSLYESVLNPVYNNLVDIVKYYYGDSELNLNALYRSLVTPVSHPWLHGELYSYNRRYFKLMDEDDYYLTGEQIRREVLNSNYLHTPALERFITYLIEMIPYWNMVHKDGRFASKKLIMDNVHLDSPPRVVKSLAKALKLVQVAIAQHNLLSGGHTLQFFESILLGDDAEMKDNVFKILENNEVIAKNFAIKLLSGKFKFTRTVDKVYVSPDERLQKNLQLYSEFRQKDSGCYYDFKENKYKNCKTNFAKTFGRRWKFYRGRMAFYNDRAETMVTIALPSSREIAMGHMGYSKYMMHLFHLREKVLEKIHENTGAWDKIKDSSGWIAF